VDRLAARTNSALGAEEHLAHTSPTLRHIRCAWYEVHSSSSNFSGHQILPSARKAAPQTPFLMNRRAGHLTVGGQMHADLRSPGKRDLVQSTDEYEKGSVSRLVSGLNMRRCS
jgi:hypothetical protein